jgi:hypothetical protein
MGLGPSTDPTHPPTTPTKPTQAAPRCSTTYKDAHRVYCLVRGNQGAPYWWLAYNARMKIVLIVKLLNDHMLNHPEQSRTPSIKSSHHGRIRESSEAPGSENIDRE